MINAIGSNILLKNKSKINNILINNLINCYGDLIEIDDAAADHMHRIADFVINPSPKTWRAVLELFNEDEGNEFISEAGRIKRTHR